MMAYPETARLHVRTKKSRSKPPLKVSKESACSPGDLGSIPGLGKYPREGNSKQLQYSCLENPMDRGAWRATVHGSQESDTI